MARFTTLENTANTNTKRPLSFGPAFPNEFDHFSCKHEHVKTKNTKRQTKKMTNSRLEASMKNAFCTSTNRTKIVRQT